MKTAIFIATKKPLNDETTILFGHKFDVKDGQYVAEISAQEAKIMAGHGWGTIEKTEEPEKVKSKPSKAKTKEV